MADGKQQPQQSAEKQNPQTYGDSAAKAELLKKAQEKFAKADVGSDGKDDSKDSEYRKLALTFVQKECLSLPDDRFQMLVEKITEVLKRKNLEKSGLETEFKNVRDEISKEISSPAKSPAIDAQSTKSDAKIGKARTVMNTLMDKVGYDREILRSNFESSKLNKLEIESSANYIEFVAKNWMAEFMRDVRKSPDRFLGFCKHWWPNHPVYKELVSRNEPGTATQIESLRLSFSATYGIMPYLQKNNPTAAETTAEKARLGKILDEVNRADAFWKIREKGLETALDKDSKVSVSTEYLKTITDGKHGVDLQAFVRKAQSNARIATSIVFDWNDTHPVYTALLAENTPQSKNALALVSGLKNSLEKRVGLKKPENSKEKRAAFEKLLIQDVDNAQKWEDIDAKSKSFESMLAEKLRIFKDLSKNGSEEQVTKEKRALVAFVERSINPLIEQTNGLLGMSRPGTEEYKLHQDIYKKLLGRRLASEYLIAEDWNGGIWSAWNDKTLTLTQSGLNKEAEKKKREEAFLNNLEGKISFQTYSKKEGNHVKTFEQFEAEITAADAKGVTFKELNSNDLFGYLKGANAIWLLHGPHLMQILPKTALQNAIYYGVKNGKIDRSFQSETLKKLMAWTPEEQKVAKNFQNALLYIVNQQVSKEKIDKDGFPALKKYMEDRGNGAKFEAVKAKLENAKDGMSNLEALMEAMGTSPKDPKSVEKFLNVDLPAISKTVNEDLKAKIDVSKASCFARYPETMTVRGSGLTPLLLKTSGADTAFLEGIFLKRIGALSLVETKNLERLVKSALAKAEKNKLDYETKEFLKDQLTPLEALISAKAFQNQYDQLSALADMSAKGTPKQKQEMKAAVLNPEDKSKTAKVEAFVASGVQAKETEREAALEEKVQKNDPENKQAMDDVAKALGFANLDDILSNETSTTKAWQELVKHSEKYEKMPGYAKIRELLEKKFAAVYYKKVHDWSVNDFFTAIEKEHEVHENAAKKQDSEKWSLGSESDRQLRQSLAETAERSAWSKKFFESESSEYGESEFMKKVPVGEKVSISTGYAVERTATWVAFVTPDGKWKVDGKAAEGALSIAKTLHESGADFFISSIGKIAAAEGIGYKDGMVSESDERRLFIFMADFFGIRNFDKGEPDVTVMQEKFTLAVSWEGRSLKQKGKDIGIVSESGSLIHSKLDERLAAFNAYRAKSAATQERSTVMA